MNLMLCKNCGQIEPRFEKKNDYETCLYCPICNQWRGAIIDIPISDERRKFLKKFGIDTDEKIRECLLDGMEYAIKKYGLNDPEKRKELGIQ